MTTIYELRGFMMRQTLSAAAMVIVFFYGWWELLRPGAEGMDFLFGIVFIGGGVWGVRSVLTDSRDAVAKLEIGEDGTSVTTLWRPFRPLVLTTDQPLDQWRYYVKIAGRGVKRPFLYLRHPDHPRELQLELRADVTITDGLRELAGGELAEFDALVAPRESN